MEQMASITVTDGLPHITSYAKADSAAPPAAGDSFESSWLCDIDGDLAADFASVGIELDGFDGAQPIVNGDAVQRATAASLFLRLAGVEELALAQLRETMMAQVEVITAYYERQMDKHATRRAMFTRFVEAIARDAAAAGDFGKKKSANTPFGQFGVSDKSASVVVSDTAALLAHLTANAPQFVRVETKLSLDEAREILTPSVLDASDLVPLWGELKKTLTAEGELPPGVERVAAQRVPFAKPEVLFTDRAR